jgi:hypothetical protein
LTVKAILRGNDNIETEFNAEFTASITELENTLKASFPVPEATSNLFFLGHTEHLQLVKIVREAHILSYRIQHGFVSCGLFVTAVSVLDGVFGMYSFGLDCVSAMDMDVNRTNYGWLTVTVYTVSVPSGQ